MQLTYILYTGFLFIHSILCCDINPYPINESFDSSIEIFHDTTILHEINYSYNGLHDISVDSFKDSSIDNIESFKECEKYYLQYVEKYQRTREYSFVPYMMYIEYWNMDEKEACLIMKKKYPLRHLRHI